MKRLLILSIATVAIILVVTTAAPTQIVEIPDKVGLFDHIQPSAVSTQVVKIPDPNLKQAIRKKLGISQKQPIFQKDMLRLKKLRNADFWSPGLEGITDLIGLEYATNLTSLDMVGHSLSDLSPLANLTNLKNLWLANCEISDITPLVNLTQLTHLALLSNPITDISSLANLTQLHDLSLDDTDVHDLNPLANLTRLHRLSLKGTKVRDLSPLVNLELNDLNLGWTDIRDLSPLNNVKHLSLISTRFTDLSKLERLPIVQDLTISRVSTPFRVQVAIKDMPYDRLEKKTKSYVNRELRSLQDVKIVDKDPDWILLIKAGARNMLMIHVLPTVIVKYVGLTPTTVYEYPMTENFVAELYGFDPDDPNGVRTMCEDIVIDFDVEWLEPVRQR